MAPRTYLPLLAGFLCCTAWSQSLEERKSDGSAAPAAATTREENVEPAVVAEEVIEQTNDFREQQGRAALAWDGKLASTASQFAQFMARTDRYDHHADGRRPSERAHDSGYGYCIIAENIAYQYRSTGFASKELARALVEGWKNSPPHRRNMMDPDVVDTGVGVARSSTSGHWYAVQMFGLPQSAQTTFQISNDARVTIEYRVGDQTFKLAPRVTRTHERCRVTPLTIDWRGEQPATTFSPRSGERYVAMQDDSGRWRLQRE